MTFHLVHPEIYGAGQSPPGYFLICRPRKVDRRACPAILVRRKVDVGGDRLVDAQPSFDQNRPVISFRFDQAGARKFGAVTTRSVGRLLAIVLTTRSLCAADQRANYRRQRHYHAGAFSVQETQDTSLLLRAGALPAPVSFLEERTVGPGLGRDSVEAGKSASLIGLALVVVFMFVIYGRFGLMADVALLFNIALIFALLSTLQATLTLPGIAIVLTMGMAVDANVLILERIREETKAGRGFQSARSMPDKRALTTIIDSNLTTLIASVLLFAFGSGPIKGFAVTLSIGILINAFTGNHGDSIAGGALRGGAAPRRCRFRRGR